MYGGLWRCFRVSKVSGIQNLPPGKLFSLRFANSFRWQTFTGVPEKLKTQVPCVCFQTILRNRNHRQLRQWVLVVHKSAVTCLTDE